MASTWRRKILVEKMALEADISKARAGRALDALLHGVEEALKMGDKVTLTGFGTFQAADHKARRGHNPRTGQPLHIPARRVPRFVAGAKLKRSIAGAGAPLRDSWRMSTR